MTKISDQGLEVENSMAEYDGGYKKSGKVLVAPTAPMTLEQRLAQTEKILRELQTQSVTTSTPEGRLVNKPKIERHTKIENLGTHIVVHGDINLSQFNLTQLPDLSLVIVEGDFNCSNNNLINLVGAPMKVTRSFNCAHNKLTSLKGAPKEVGKDFNCSYNQLSTLEHGPQNVGWLVPLWSGFNCSYNQLITLQGAPKSMPGDFDCSANQLTSPKYAPEYIYGNFNATNNPFDKYALLAFSKSHLQDYEYWKKRRKDWLRSVEIFMKREKIEGSLKFVAGSFVVSIAGSGEIFERKDLQKPLRLAYKYGGIKGVMKVLTYNLMGGDAQTVPALPKPAVPAPASQTILIPAPELSAREHFEAALKKMNALDPTQRAEFVKEILLLAADNFNDAAGQKLIAATAAEKSAEQILAEAKAKLAHVQDTAQTLQRYIESVHPDMTEDFWRSLRTAAAEDLEGQQTSMRDTMIASGQSPAP